MIELKIVPGIGGAAALARIKALAWEHPGEHELAVLVPSRTPEQFVTLKLGPFWKYDPCEDLLAALGEFGEVEVTPD